jgi:hypothetical protein
MSVCMCVTKLCNEYKFAPSMRDVSHLVEHHVISHNSQRNILLEHHVTRIVLDVTMVRDDSNLLYSDISQGDELKPN